MLSNASEFVSLLAFSLNVVGEWVYVESSKGIRVKADAESTVYVTLDVETMNSETISGLCGNANDNANEGGKFFWNQSIPTYAHDRKYVAIKHRELTVPQQVQQ